MLRHMMNYIDKTPTYAQSKRLQANIGIGFRKFLKYWNLIVGTLVLAALVAAGLYFVASASAQAAIDRENAQSLACTSDSDTALEKRWNSEKKSCQVHIVTKEGPEFWMDEDVIQFYLTGQY